MEVKDCLVSLRQDLEAMQGRAIAPRLEADEAGRIGNGRRAKLKASCNKNC
jgi:hypothetical protein